jgi:ankyrin repeat protein
MSYKNVLALILVTQTLLTQATFCVDTPLTAPHSQLVTKQQTSSQNAYENPSPEILQADKEFCLKTISDMDSDINALSPSGKTSLQLLILYFINNFTTERLIALALKRGANANVRDEQGRTPLFFITAYTLCPKVFEEKQAAVDTMVASQHRQEETSEAATKTVEISPSTQAARNPLHDRSVSLAVLELLLAFSADPTITDKDDISPLLLAVTTGDQEVVELFARYGLLEKIFQEIAKQEAASSTIESENSPESTPNL